MRVLFAAVATAIVLVGAGGAIGVVASRPDPAIQRKADALDRFCRGTRVGHDTVLTALENALASRTSASIATDMVDRDLAYFGRTSVETCLDGKAPPPRAELALCKLENNYDCLAKQVRIYRDALVRAGW